jgi:hypothetical protein
MLGISKGFLKQWVAPLVVAVVASFSILMAAQDQGTPFVEGQNGVFSGPSANPGPVASTAYIDASPIYNNPNQGKSDICLTINWILTSTGAGGFNYTSNYAKGAVIDERGILPTPPGNGQEPLLECVTSSSFNPFSQLPNYFS